MAESSERELTPDEASYVTAAREKAFVLHEGVPPIAAAAVAAREAHEGA
jgi:hypothetical protein